MSLPAITAQDLVDAGIYNNENQVFQEALRHFLLTHPDVRVTVAIYLYRNDQELTLARVAAIAGVSLERMKELLLENGVPLRLGPGSVEEARTEVENLQGWFRGDPD
jgi:predicted HTH domain antitoxin